MKHTQPPKSLMALSLLAAAVGPTSAAVLFSDADPGAGIPSAGLTVTNQADPAPASAGDTAGLLGDLTQQFSSISTGPISLPSQAIGNPFSLSIDYYIPANTLLDAGDLIYLQINIDGSNRGSVGFIDAGAAPQDTWQTLTLTNLNFPAADPTNGPNLPAGAIEIVSQFIIVDGGFGGTANFPAGGGPAILVDNFTFEAVPEPSHTALLALGGLCCFLRRKR